MLAVYTDGASSPATKRRPAVGGWAWWVADDRYRIGNASPATSNRMELQAVIDAMMQLTKAAKRNDGLIIYTDSLYVVNCFAEEWYVRWRKNDWKKVIDLAVVEVKNRDLWEKLLAIHEAYQKNEVPVSFRHIRGHGLDPNADPVHVFGNDKADKLAVQAKKMLMNGS